MEADTRHRVRVLGEGANLEHIQSQYQRFKALHRSGNTFVMANAWDAGSARLLSSLEFEALATTSAGYAFSVGKRDSFAALSRDEILTNAAAIVSATDLPVTGDLEDGFGTSSEDCVQTIIEAMKVGLVGGSIEDATGDADAPIHELSLAVERVQAAAEAARDKPFLLTARAENYLWGRPDLADTIARLQAFSEAGAQVLYAPGLPDLEAIRTVCAEVDKPVNVVMGLSGRAFTVADLADAGVCRISVGGSFARAAMGAMMRAGREVLEQGTFTYADQAMSNAEASGLMAQTQPFKGR